MPNKNMESFRSAFTDEEWKAHLATLSPKLRERYHLALGEFEEDDDKRDAAHFRALQAKMVDCGWGDEVDGTVNHERLGMQQPSWVAAISACIEVASEV
jgi:hypothetical protein